MAALLGSPSIAETGAIRIATGEYAPFTDSTAPNGGTVNEFVQEIAEVAGYEVEFDYLPWMRGLELTRLGRYAGASYWFFNEEREADFIHVGPVNIDRMVLFRRADADIPAWSDIGDLADLTLGAVTGYTYTPDFWEMAESGQLNVQVAQNDEANIRKLLAGRIDVYPMSEAAGRALLQEHFSEAERAQITIEAQPLFVMEGFLLISRQTDNAEELALNLQAAIDG